MLVENRLNSHGFSEVQLQEPSLISPSKTSAGPGSPMEVEENGIVLVTDEDVDPMPQLQRWC